MSLENVLWSALHIQGELLKLGFAVARSTVAKYMAKKGNPSGQSWGTFLRNHAPQIAAMDLFVVPTVGFAQLYVLVIAGWRGASMPWSMSRDIQRRNGSRSRSPKPSRGMGLHAI